MPADSLHSLNLKFKIRIEEGKDWDRVKVDYGSSSESILSSRYRLNSSADPDQDMASYSTWLDDGVCMSHDFVMSCQVTQRGTCYNLKLFVICWVIWASVSDPFWFDFLYLTLLTFFQEAHTMAERDLGSTLLMPQTHLYRPDRVSVKICLIFVGLECVLVTWVVFISNSKCNLC